ncbi:major facilitator superfamily domain-containing protein [Leucosporidium creatinivorum]|uniref:Major facilitator superfamily domain-containing protein n=1 Tax=Leucosporidium creatinivorum TaxID=106004 RepID=A0A1Y2EUV1_9BASI|nr:major facilitator superfamily domain-containing protein [Leucosporidium creatinivorum]
MDSRDDETTAAPTRTASIGSKMSTKEDTVAEKSQDIEVQAQLPAEPLLPPLEGRRAWLMATGGFLGLFATFGFTNGFGAYQNYYLQQYDTTSATISLVGGLQVAMLYLGGPFSGRAVDVFGPKLVIGTGTIICTFSLMMLSLTSAIWQVFLCQGLLYGIGMSFVFFPCISMPATYFLRHRGLAIAFVTCGASLGGVIWPIMLSRLLREVGFGWSTRISAFVVLVACGAATIILEPRVAPKRGQSIIPDFSLLRKKSFLALLLANCIGYFALFGPIFNIQSRAVSLGVRASLTPYILPILNAVSLLGRIIPGMISDRLGPMNTWTMANFLGAIVIFAAWIPSHNELGILWTAALYGITSGAWVSVLPGCVPRLAGPENVASSFGLLYFMSWPGGLAGAALGGLFIHPNAENAQVGYQRAGILWGCLLLASTCLVIVSRLLHNSKLLAAE